MRRRRRGTQNIEDLSARIEQYAESLLDICAEERRLTRMLTRVRAAKAGLIAFLGEIAKAEAKLRKARR